MGFGLLIVFVVFPSILMSIIVGLIWPKIGVKLFVVWSTSIMLIVLANIISSIISEIKLVKSDEIVGEYVIDKRMFPGKNSNWQYDHYVINISEEEIIVKYLNLGKIQSIESVEIDFLEYYKNHRVKLVGDSEHHMFQEHPLLVREGWSYYYVINSYKYGNMYFKKGKWKK